MRAARSVRLIPSLAIAAALGLGALAPAGAAPATPLRPGLPSGSYAETVHPDPAGVRAGGPLRGMYLGNSVDAKSTYAMLGDLPRLKADGVNTIALYVFLRTHTASGTTVTRDTNAMPDQVLTAIIEAVHAHGMAVSLIPFVRVWGPGTWHGRLMPSNPSAWFASYRAALAVYERLAESLGVEVFSLGTELELLQQDRFLPEWSRVAAEARANFSGVLTYGATNPATVSWWHLVDYIGVSAYYSLSSKPNPAVGELVSVWRTYYLPTLRALSAKYARKVLFGEVGYTSNSLTAWKPATIWATHEGTLSLKAQAAAYQALLEVTRTEPWFAGVQWFHWDRPQNAQNAKYEPRSKPAECVLASYWAPGGNGLSALRTRKGLCPVAHASTARMTAGLGPG